MKKFFPLLILCVLVVLVYSACEDDDQVQAMTAEINLNFKATMDGTPLEMGVTYDYAGTAKIQITKFDYFIGDAVLTQNENGSSVESELTDIDYINLSKTSTVDAEAGEMLNTRAVEADGYTGIKFGIGVPADLNAKEWTEYAGGHPLRTNGDTHYWSAWSSFIFAKMEGKFDADGDGTFESSFTYHTGTDDLLEEISFNANLDLKADESRTITFLVDMKKLFQIDDSTYDANDDGYVDLDVHQGVHTDQQLELAKEIMGNFEDAITLSN